MNRVVALARNPWARGLFVLASLVLAILAVWWRGPDWNTVYHAFDFVSWRWVIVGVLLNLLSVLARAWAWNVTIRQAMPEPLPKFRQVFSAFGVGLLANAVLPARAGVEPTYTHSQEAFDLYKEEIEASPTVVGELKALGLQNEVAGLATDGDPVRDETIKYLNGEQTVEETIENVTTAFNEAFAG